MYGMFIYKNKETNKYYTFKTSSFYKYCIRLKYFRNNPLFQIVEEESNFK